MALQLIVLAALLGASSAGVISAPLAVSGVAGVAAPVVAVDSEYNASPVYSFAYDVQDALTGDSKRQQESRDGDVVRGSYSVDDPDNTRRTVFYESDAVRGFRAVVRREPHTAVTIASPLTTLATPVTVSSTSSSRVDVPRVDTLAVAALPRFVSAGSPFTTAVQQVQLQQVQLQQLQQLQQQQQLQQLQQQQQLHQQQVQQQQIQQHQLQQLQPLVNPLALATNLGLTSLAGLRSPILQAAPWA